jgi:glutaredoxin 3
MKQPEVIIYTKECCPYCHAAKRLLTDKGAGFREVDVTGDSKALEEVSRRSGFGTVPQIFIGSRSIGGFRELQALDASGELARLLAGSK